MNLRQTLTLLLALTILPVTACTKEDKVPTGEELVKSLEDAKKKTDAESPTTYANSGESCATKGAIAVEAGSGGRTGAFGGGRAGAPGFLTCRDYGDGLKWY